MRQGKARLRLSRNDSINQYLQGFWPLSGGAGTLAVDISANRRHGTLTGFGLSAGSGWRVGDLGTALQFDGTNDYVSVPMVQPITRITLSCWVKSTGGGSNSIVVSKNFSGGVVPFCLSVSTGAGAAVGMSFYNGSWRASGVATEIQNDGKWHFVAGTYDGTTLRYYLDGKLNSSFAYTGNLPNNTNVLQIGSYTTSYFSGTMCLLRLHSRALSPSEILRLYSDPWAGTQRAMPLAANSNSASFSPIVMGLF